MIFAQIPATTPESLGSWLIDLAAVLVMGYYAVRLISHFRRTPPIEAEFVSRKEYAESMHEIKIDLGSIRNDLRQTVADLGTTHERRSIDLHKRINDLQQITGELKGIVQTLTQRYDQKR